MWHPKRLNIGDIVYHHEFGIGRIEAIDNDIFGSDLQYLVYYYKENKILHNGNGGESCHYWWSYIEDLTIVSPLHNLIERRRHG